MVGADTECCSANWNSGNGLELAKKDATTYRPSNAHKSGIIDTVQIDNAKFKMEKGIRIGKEMFAGEDIFWYVPQTFCDTRWVQYKHRVLLIL